MAESMQSISLDSDGMRCCYLIIDRSRNFNGEFGESKRLARINPQQLASFIGELNDELNTQIFFMQTQKIMPAACVRCALQFLQQGFRPVDRRTRRAHFHPLERSSFLRRS